RLATIALASGSRRRSDSYRSKAASQCNARKGEATRRACTEIGAFSRRRGGRPRGRLAFAFDSVNNRRRPDLTRARAHREGGAMANSVSRASDNGVHVVAYRGEGNCLLAFDLDPGLLTPDFVGFSVEVRYPGSAKWYALTNRLNFTSEPDATGK